MLVRTTVAAFLMLAVVWWWRDRSLPLAVFAGVLIYPAAALLLRAAPRHELDLVHSVVLELFGKLRRRMHARLSTGD
jgi:hypothetical protein